MNRQVLDTMLSKVYGDSDMSWEKIVEKYDLDMSPDHLRKMSYGAKLYHELVLENAIDTSTEGQYDELNERLNEIKEERVKLQDMRTLVNRKSRDNARADSLRELAQDCAKRFDTDKPLISDNIITKVGKNVGILNLSDLHIGLVIDNNWNKFDTEQAKYRLSVVVKNTIEYCNLHKINTLKVLFTGDLISGNIHTTIRIENRENVTQQVILASEILSEVLFELSKEFNIEVHFACGNHGRITVNKHDSLDGENFERFIVYFMEQRCTNVSNIKFKENVIEDDLISFKLGKYNIVATHGDKYGNKNNIVHKIGAMMNIIPDYVLIGHYHHNYLNTVGSTEIIANSSLSGTDSYAVGLGLVSRPSQNLLIMNEEIGKIALYHIYLD